MYTRRHAAYLAAVGLAGGLLAGCEDRKPPTPTPPTPTQPGNRGTTTDPARPGDSNIRRTPGNETVPDADNTARNRRDNPANNPSKPTPFDHSENEADRTLTATVRRSVLAIEGLSVNGQNIKIISNAGTVTLRGPVKSAEERAEIERVVRTITGVTRLDNQLEVAGR